MIHDVIKRTFDNPDGYYLMKQIHPEFKAPNKKFKRMDYADAIKWLKDNDVRKKDGSFYEFGEGTKHNLYRYS